MIFFLLTYMKLWFHVEIEKETNLTTDLYHGYINRYSVVDQVVMKVLTCEKSKTDNTALNNPCQKYFITLTWVEYSNPRITINLKQL